VVVGPDIAGARLTFQVPAGAEVVRVVRRLGTCPSSVDDPAAELVASETGTAGATVEAFDYGLEAPGRYCYAVVAVGRLGRPGRVATAFYDHAGVGGGAGPPVADFDWQPDADAPRLVFFEEFSEDPDDDVVSWEWSFGDGATASGPSADHAYAAPGSYDVTLTVTDAAGNRASTTRTVEVADSQAAP